MKGPPLIINYRLFTPKDEEMSDYIDVEYVYLSDLEDGSIKR